MRCTNEELDLTKAERTVNKYRDGKDMKVNQ
jgi:hypothetical protein